MLSSYPPNDPTKLEPKIVLPPKFTQIHAFFQCPGTSNKMPFATPKVP